MEIFFYIFVGLLVIYIIYVASVEHDLYVRKTNAEIEYYELMNIKLLNDNFIKVDLRGKRKNEK